MAANGPPLISPERSGKLPTQLGLYYGGKWQAARSGATSPTIDPATGETIAHVSWADAGDVELATASAERGFALWRKTSAQERGRTLLAFAAQIRENAAQLAWLDAIDAGMPIAQVFHDVEIAARAIEFCAGLVTEIKGDTLPPGNNELTYTLRQPLGVVARIVAFNHPFMFAASRAAAPLAAGNALILKPSEHAPLSAMRLAELSEGLFPAGVINVLPGGKECGEALSKSPRVRKVSLIGSVATGKAVLRAAAESIKETALELGGKNALIAYPDTDPEAVANAIFRGMNFAWGGQSCGSTSRAFVHTDVHDAVVARVAEKCRNLKPGVPTDPSSGMGCLINMNHRSKVEAFVKSALAAGARLEAGGQIPADPLLAAGAFYEPTVFSNVTSDMRIAREEIFGPVLSVLRWSDEEKMLAAVNDTEFGLTAAIWTENLSTALRVAEAVEVGYVWINGVGTHIHGAPFGGIKQSGLGREESIDEILSYTTLKTVNVRILSSS
jgi:betaine-aldehyde dehydrogenase